MTTSDFVPPANAFSHPFVVPKSDIDDLGHASNVSFVRWVQDAAASHSESVGLGLAAYRDLGVLWVVRRHDIEYLAPAFAGDALTAETWVATLRGATSLRRTLILRGDTPLCRAETTWVLVSIASGRPTRVPAELLSRYGFSPGSSR